MTNSSDLDHVLNKINAIVQDGAAPAGQQNALSRFVDMLIEEKGFPDMTPEVKDQLRRDLLRKLDDYIAAKIISSLSDEDVNIFHQMLKEGRSSEEMQRFTTTHIENFSDFLTNTLLMFRGVYLGLIHVPSYVNVDVKEAVEKVQHQEKQEAPRARLTPAPVMSQPDSEEEKKVIN